MAMLSGILAQSLNRPGFSAFAKANEEFEERKKQREQQAALQQQQMEIAPLQMQKARLEIEGIKQRMENPAFDLNKTVQGALMKHNMGQEITPQERAAIQTSIMLNPAKTQYKPDESGRVQAVTTPNPLQSIFGGNFIPQGARPTTVPSPSVQTAQAAPLESQIQDMTLEDIENAIGSVTPSKAAPMSAPIDPYYLTGPKAQAEGAQQALKGKADIMTAEGMLPVKESEADIAAAAKGATELSTQRAKQQAVEEIRKKVIPTIEQNMADIEAEIANLPSGGFEDTIGAGVSYFGLPVKAQQAKARINAPLKAMILDMKRIVRDAGEGIFTKDDQEFVESFMLSPTAEYSEKLAAFQGFKQVLGRIKERLATQPFDTQMQTGAPGFKYLGKAE